MSFMWLPSSCIISKSVGFSPPPLILNGKRMLPASVCSEPIAQAACEPSIEGMNRLPLSHAVISNLPERICVPLAV